MKTFQQWADYLGSKPSRPVGNNTRAVRLDANSIAIRLHQTDVVTLHSDGRVVLASGGWRTATTKDRINTHAPAQIRQDSGVWRFGWFGEEYLFADGVTLHPEGTVTGAAMPSAVDADKALRKYVSAYAKLVESKLPLEKPNLGDCFYCQLNRQGDSVGGTEHLRSHLEEGYVVPSLVWSALEAGGCNPQGGGSAWFCAAFEKDFQRLGTNTVGRMVKKYLLRRFGLA